MRSRPRCLSDRALRAHVRRMVRGWRHAAIEAHLAACVPCRWMTEALSEALALGVGADALRTRVDKADRAVMQFEMEPPHRLHVVIGASEWSGDRFVAGRLLERSREEFSREPRRSMYLARAAIIVAERSGSVALQFEGWRDCVSIAVFLGSFAEAWDAIDHAANLAEQMNDDHARAIVLYARAYVGSQPDVWMLDDALAWTEAAERIFARTEPARLRATAEMRAYLHYCKGEYDTAVEICERLWVERREVELAVNFGSYLVAAQKLKDAEDVIKWGAAAMSRSDAVTLARHTALEGRLEAARGLWQRAAEAFARAREMFDDLAMHDTAVRIELGRIRAAVSTAPDSVKILDEARQALQQLVRLSAELDECQPSRRRRFTAEAIAYLREVAEANALTSDLLGYAWEYLEAMSRGPARPFLRSVPPLLM